MTLVNLSRCVLKGGPGWAARLVVVCAAMGLVAQETPRPNRVAWFEGFPEPLPEGVSELALEATSQMLRPDLAHSSDRRTYAILDGEEWQLVWDWALQAGSPRVNIRTRLAYRSGGIADQALWNWHQMFNMPQGGREQALKNQLDYYLLRDGKVVGELNRPGLALMDLDVAWIRPFGTSDEGGRLGASVPRASSAGLEECDRPSSAIEQLT